MGWDPSSNIKKDIKFKVKIMSNWDQTIGSMVPSAYISEATKLVSISSKQKKSHSIWVQG